MQWTVARKVLVPMVAHASTCLSDFHAHAPLVSPELHAKKLRILARQELMAALLLQLALRLGLENIYVPAWMALNQLTMALLVRT